MSFRKEQSFVLKSSRIFLPRIPLMLGSQSANHNGTNNCQLFYEGISGQDNYQTWE